MLCACDAPLAWPPGAAFSLISVLRLVQWFLRTTTREPCLIPTICYVVDSQKTRFSFLTMTPEMVPPQDRSGSSMWAAGCQPLIFPMTDPGAKVTLLVLASLPCFCRLPRGRQLEVSGGPDLGGSLLPSCCLLAPSLLGGQRGARPRWWVSWSCPAGLRA